MSASANSPSRFRSQLEFGRRGEETSRFLVSVSCEALVAEHQNDSSESPPLPEGELEAFFPALKALLPLLQRPLPRRVFHYTPQRSGVQILESSSIWASHIRHLPGDPEEYQKGLALTASKLQCLLEAETDPYVYDLLGRWGYQWPRIREHGWLVASLSSLRDSTSHWTEFGRIGYSFGFDAEVLNEIAGQVEFTLFECLYENDDHEVVCAGMISDALGTYHRLIADGYDHEQAAMPAKVIFEISISNAMPRLKKEQLRVQSEYRLLSTLPLEYRKRVLRHREGKGGIMIPYEEVPFRNRDGRSALREIMVAPDVDYKSAKLELESALKKFGYKGVEITRSAIGTLR